MKEIEMAGEQQERVLAAGGAGILGSHAGVESEQSQLTTAAADLAAIASPAS